MWLTRILSFALLLSGIAIAYFVADILAWTFGVEWLNPLRALYGFGVWSLPFSSLLYWMLKKK